MFASDGKHEIELVCGSTCWAVLKMSIKLFLDSLVLSLVNLRESVDRHLETLD